MSIEKVVYVSHEFGGKQENADKVATLVTELSNLYPTICFMSPIHAFGLFAMIPNLLVALLNSIVIFPKDIFNARKLLVVKLIFGPLHAFVEMTGDTPLSFFLVCLIVPIIAGAGYLMGYYGIYPMARFLGKKE